MPLNREPYIPGSSLRGKMRSLLDRHFNNPLYRQGSVQFHECQDLPKLTQNVQCAKYLVLHHSKLRGQDTMPTRLIVRDTFLTPVNHVEASRQQLIPIADFTEIKMGSFY